MIDPQHDPLAASLRLQLEGDIRLQEGDHELVYEEQWAVVRPVQKKPFATYYFGPAFAAFILALFWAPVFFLPLAASLLIGFFILLFTIGIGLAIVHLHRAFGQHRARPPLVRLSAHRKELPQAGAAIDVSELLALSILRVPLKFQVGDQPPKRSGTFDQAGIVHRNPDGGISATVLASTH